MLINELVAHGWITSYFKVTDDLVRTPVQSQQGFRQFEIKFVIAFISTRTTQTSASHLLRSRCLIRVPFKVPVVSRVTLDFSVYGCFVTTQLFGYFSGTHSLLSECRNHIPFILGEVRVFHVFYFLAGANFMIIAPYCFYVQGGPLRT